MNVVHLKAGKEGSVCLLLHKMLLWREIHEVFLSGRSADLGKKILEYKVLSIIMKDVCKNMESYKIRRLVKYSIA